MKTQHPPQTPWQIREQDFPRTGTAAEKLRFCLHYAVLAPSTHNTQPWRFKIAGDAVELYADLKRALPVTDPHGRELLISCGAALFNLCVALRHFGHVDDTELLPADAEPDLLARVRLGKRCAPGAEDHALFRAIPRRHTNRLPFAARPVSRFVLAALEAAARTEGTWLHIANKEEREELADLIWEADRTQWADWRFREETAAWLNPNPNRRRDGIPGYAHGAGVLMAVAGPFVLRTFDLGRGLSEKDRNRALAAPALLVLGTDGDEPLDWLRAGLALERLLLTAVTEGLGASFFNQPLQIPELRPQVRAAIDETGFAQMILRVGYANEVRPTPRRPPEEVCNPAEQTARR